MASATAQKNPPQAFISSYAARLRNYSNSLLTPVAPVAQPPPLSRKTKRGTTAINYAEDGFDDTDLDDSEGPRRLTGLRSLRRDDLDLPFDPAQRQRDLGKELARPVDVQGVWRDWMGHKHVPARTDKQRQITNALPLTLVPIRIDVDIPSFRPAPALPRPSGHTFDETNPAYRSLEPTPAYRLKDSLMWNLHEALITPDQFARILVDDLDMPADKKPAIAVQVATQIRTQLEEYAGVALHPLFHSTWTIEGDGTTTKTIHPARSRDESSTPNPIPSTPIPSGLQLNSASAADEQPQVSANASPLRNGQPNGNAATALPTASILNPDDTYRCIVNLSIYLKTKHYTDRLEWSLLHPPGLAEMFAKRTCADLGLAGEWVPAITHAMYEAVLKLKKEACERGGLMSAYEIDNDTLEDREAGWRFGLRPLGVTPEEGGSDWEPRLETLSKEEMEKRELDRERQVRRVRRETARFSSTTGLGQGGMPEIFDVGRGRESDVFGLPQGSGARDNAGGAGAEESLGRGERSKKKRRFRSLSPVGRDTPGATTGYGGDGTNLMEAERQSWRCSHCLVWGSAVWAVRDGPQGPRTLCHNCGLLYERDKQLPPWSKDLFLGEKPYPA